MLHSISLADGNVEINAKFRTPKQALDFATAVHTLLYAVSDRQLRDEILHWVETRGENSQSIIALIKGYREITGSGLKESKDWVEAHMADVFIRNTL
jgi:ribosomal protein L7/L12